MIYLNFYKIYYDSLGVGWELSVIILLIVLLLIIFTVGFPIYDLWISYEYLGFLTNFVDRYETGTYFLSNVIYLVLNIFWYFLL